MVRLILAFVIATLVATIGLSAVSTYSVQGNLAKMGYPLAAEDRLPMYLNDLAGLGPAAGGINLIGLLIAFGIIRSGFPAVHPVTIRSVQIAFCKSSRLPTASDVMNVLVIAAIMASFMILRFVQIQLGHL